MITRPRTVARTVAGNLRKALDDEKEGYLPELDFPYVYYQQGELRRGKLIAPGNVRLLPTHARVLEKFIRREKNFLAHVDPDGEGRPCLTPGPGIISWWYIIKLVILVAAGVLLFRFTRYFLLVFFLLLYFPSLIKVGFSAYYPEGLVGWLRPADKEEKARPQVQRKVVEPLSLPKEQVAKEKLKG